MERAFEFRNRCISTQMYFSSSEYKCHFDQSRRQKQLDNSTEKESTIVKVKFLPHSKKNEETNLEFNAHSDINFKNDLQIAVESECDFEGEDVHSIYDDDQVELENQSMEYATQKLLPWNKTRAKLEVNLENDSDEGIRVDKTIPLPVKPNNDEEGLQDDDNPKAKAKGEKKSKARTYICDQCGNNFKYRSHFYSHIKRHTGIKPLQCE